MKIFQTYNSQKGQHHVNPSLLWEYNLDHFDWHKYRHIVVERVIKLGRQSDWFGAFDLYGGIRGFRKIARDEVVDLNPRDLDFMCRAMNINKEETKCYKQQQSRLRHLSC